MSSQRRGTRSHISSIKRSLARLLRRRSPREPARLPPLPLTGYTEGRTAAPYVEILDDASLVELNSLLHWRSYTVDRKGRRFGDRMGMGGKKERPGEIPDRRIVLMHAHFDLSDKHVLEVGCFEGVHTLGLVQFAAQVTAIDARVDNVVKTIVRTAFHGHRPTVFVCNLETWEDDSALSCDVVHHVGVLYHLRDPVEHLLRLPKIARHGLLLDTHVADDHEAQEEMTIQGQTYRYKRVEEPQGQDSPGAGMFDHSKWLRLDDILGILEESGFAPARLVERREERNGPRVTILAGEPAT